MTDSSSTVWLALEQNPFKQLVHETWHQRGEECTGFALAAAVNFLARRSDPAAPSVSPRMMYEMAQVYDDASFEVGSTLLGALRGWQRCGVTTEELWPYAADDEHGEIHGGWTIERISDARTRKVSSSSFPEIAPSDLDEMTAALDDGGVLYVDAEIHEGWYPPFLPPAKGEAVRRIIQRKKGDGSAGFHAFLIVGHDDDGFIVRNSWGQYWGYEGYAVLAYDDWKTNGRHVYAPAFTGPSPSLIDGAPRSAAPESREREIAKTMWGHIVALDDEGRLSSDGLYAATSSTVRSYFYLFEQHAKKHKWKRPKLLVHADDGSQPRAETVERLAKVRDELMDQEIYPIFVVWDMPWRPDFEDELEVRLPAGVPSIMAELYGPPTRSQKRYEGFLADEDLDDSFMKYFLFEGRIVSETLAVELWRAIQRRSRQACSRVDGGARILAERISNKAKEMDFDIHIAAHGTGDFLLSQFAGLLPSIGSCHLWAPATTVSEFESTYGNLYGGGRIGQMAITVLDDASERADSIGKYPESILCLASNVLAVDDIDAPERVVENWLQIPSERDAATEWRGRYERDAEPILGLERCLSQIGGIASRAHVNVVSGAHADLAMSPDVLSAVVDRIKAAPTKATQPAREPTDSHDGDNDGTDLSPPAFVRDPLESARRRWEHPQASLVATRDPLSRARLAP